MMLENEVVSRGNQVKYYKDGNWIKLDSSCCYEGLAEDFVSCFEDLISDFPHVRYTSVLDKYNGVVLYADDSNCGCSSENMFGKGVQFFSLKHIFRQFDIPYNILIKDEDTSVNIKNTIDAVYQALGIDISDYLFKILFLDALIINEDRHYMNLGVCYKDGVYFSAPCFDNGSSLFCVNWTYKERKSLEENFQRAESVAKPFSKFFDKQVDACVSLGAKPLKINNEGLRKLLLGYTNTIYHKDKIELVESVLVNRLKYYEGRGVYELV